MTYSMFPFIVLQINLLCSVMFYIQDHYYNLILWLIFNGLKTCFIVVIVKICMLYINYVWFGIQKIQNTVLIEHRFSYRTVCLTELYVLHASRVCSHTVGFVFPILRCDYSDSQFYQKKKKRKPVKTIVWTFVHNKQLDRFLCSESYIHIIHFACSQKKKYYQIHIHTNILIQGAECFQ